MEKISMRVLVTVLVLIALAFAGSVNVNKVDRTEFKMFKEYQDKQLDVIQHTLCEIREDIKDIKESLSDGERMDTYSTSK